MSLREQLIYHLNRMSDTDPIKLCIIQGNVEDDGPVIEGVFNEILKKEDGTLELYQNPGFEL